MQDINSREIGYIHFLYIYSKGKSSFKNNKLAQINLNIKQSNLIEL